jgi:hypothetical protein
MRRTINSLAIILLPALFLAGCATPPPVELDYRCVLANNASFDVARDFSGLVSAEIASKAHLQILSQTRVTGKTSNDVSYIVSLKSTVADKVFVSLLFNQPHRTIALTILGDVRDPEASLIAQRAMKAFSEMFPGSRLVPVSGNEAM